MKIHFDRILHSNLINNIFNQFILYGFGHIIPIILIPFLLNRVGIENYGLINFILAFSFYFQVINEYGFDLSNVNHVVEHRDDKTSLTKIFSSIIYCKGLLCTVTCIVYFAIVCIIDNFRINIWFYILGYIRIIGIAIAPYWLFRSMEEIKYITRIVIPIKTICTIPVFFLVKNENDALWVMVCYAAIEVVSGIVSIIIALKHYSLKLCKVSWHEIKYYFKDSTPFFLSTALMRIYKNSNTVVLRIFCGDYAVGLYSAAEKLHNAYSSFVAPIINQIFYPYFIRIKNWTKINRLVVLISVFNILILGILYILSPYVVPFFIKNGGVEITLYFNLFLALLSISIITDLLGFPYLGILSSAKTVTKTTVWGTVSYLVIIFILILCNRVTITSLILSLMLSTVACLASRIYYIRSFMKLK